MTLKKSRLIAIGGFKGVGKDTAAEMLQYLLNTPKIMHSYFLFKLTKKLFKNKWRITSFAHPLKRTLAAMLNISISKFEDRDFKENTYIRFDTMDITKNPGPFNKLNDNTFNRCLENNSFTIIRSHYITMRQLMQCWGTQTMRAEYGDKLWILLTLNSKKPTIISDLRFKVELEEVKKHLGYTIYISRPGFKAGKHASEKEVEDLYLNDKFDIVINNNGTLETLFNRLKNVAY